MGVLNSAADLTSNLEHAINYSSLGWGVFPAHTIRNGKCSCSDNNCKKPGKHPMTRNGFKDATTNRSQIIKWWNRKPDANIAIRTGKKSGLIVLDIDTKSNGFESLETLEYTYGKLPVTRKAVTGSKGNHIFFTHPGGHIKTRAGIKPGIDFRGDGGYVIAAPSLHISGNSYYWIDANKALADAPAWLIRLVNDSNQITTNTSENFIPEGTRNNTLMSIAGKKWSEGTSKNALQTFLLEENQLKCKPPLPHAEVLKITKSIISYAPGEKKFIYSWKEQFRNSDLPSSSKLVLHALSDHMNISGRNCYPTQEQLSREASLTRKTVGKHLEQCVNEGWIERYRHRSEKHECWNYGYIARLPDE